MPVKMQYHECDYDHEASVLQFSCHNIPGTEHLKCPNYSHILSRQYSYCSLLSVNETLEVLEMSQVSSFEAVDISELFLSLSPTLYRLQNFKSIEELNKSLCCIPYVT